MAGLFLFRTSALTAMMALSIKHRFRHLGYRHPLSEEHQMRKVHSVFINTSLLFGLVACSSTNTTGTTGDASTGGSTTGTATATGSAAAKGNSDANGTGKPAGGMPASGSSGTQGTTGAVIDDTTGVQKPATGTNGQ
jgi:hypothetical protein